MRERLDRQRQLDLDVRRRRVPFDPSIQYGNLGLNLRPDLKAADNRAAYGVQ
jgi:hypothetical protein